MTIQSIRRTPIPGGPNDLDYRTYQEVWPELRLKTGSVGQAMSGITGAITTAIVDSGIPSGTPGQSVVPGQDRDDDDHATLLVATIRRPPANFDIRPIKFFSAQGWPEAKLGAPAIGLAAGAGARVIVLAWDVAHTIPALEQAISAVQTTAVVVIAAGNWSLDNDKDKHRNWPANYGEMDHVLTVMATDEHDERASYSNYGKTSVYIAAPGLARVPVPSSGSPLRTSGSLRDSYRKFRGTSAAAAHVARLAALVLAKNPGWTPQQVKAHIGLTARKVNALTKFCATGAIVDFEAAL